MYRYIGSFVLLIYRLILNESTVSMVSEKKSFAILKAETINSSRLFTFKVHKNIDMRTMLYLYGEGIKF